MSWKLNDKSPILGQPDELKLPLKRHQLAMLHRCLSIEKKAYTNIFPYGIMSDKAGAGKTSVIISVILADKIMYGKTQNLIIVPQNIHTQWINEFEKFCGDKLKVKSFVEYSDISELFFNNTVLNEYDVLITTSLYYDTIINILQQIGSNIRRLIFDEIDTLYSILDNLEEKNTLKCNAAKKEIQNKKLIEEQKIIGSKNKMIWFISASFDNSITSNGFKFRDKVIPINQLQNIMCKCEDEFIDKYNFNLIKPELQIYKCEDISDDYFDCLSTEQLDYINSLSFQNIHYIYNNKISNNSIEAIKNLTEDYNISINKSIEIIKELSKNKVITDNIQHEINKNEKNKIFLQKLLMLFHKIKCNQDCENQAKCIYEKINNISYDNTKLKNIEELFKNIDKTKDKILIFSDFTGAFKIISKMLDNLNIKYTELHGGNIKSINKSIELYKNQDINVLMVDSSSEGCGVNLENTTHLIFIHKTSEILYNQIIGRAQRPGRTSQLKIISFLNNNEII